MRQCCCLVCGEPIIRGTPWTHVHCLKGPGWDLTVAYRDWPEWAKVLKRDEERQRRAEPVEVISLDMLMERDGD